MFSRKMAGARPKSPASVKNALTQYSLDGKTTMEQNNTSISVLLGEELGHTDNMEARSQAITLRRLEIAATLAEWKRAFFVDGIERSLEDRLTLMAEDAALALEKRVIGGKVEAAKIERRRRQNATMLAQLVALLTERGMGDIIAEAEKRAADTH